MATPNKMKKIATENGEPIETVILRTLNECKTVRRAAQELNITEANLFQWIARHGIAKRTDVTWFETPKQS